METIFWVIVGVVLVGGFIAVLAALHELGQAVVRLYAIADDLREIKGEIKVIRRATLHQGPYEP